MNLKNRIIALVAATAIAAPVVAVAKHRMKPGKGEEETPMAFFKVKLSPAGGIDGKTADVTIDDDGNNVTVLVDLARVNTGMELRNEHFQSKLLKRQKKDEKFVAKLSVKTNDVKGKASGSAPGTLSIKTPSAEKSRPVRVDFTTKDLGGGRTRVDALLCDPKVDEKTCKDKDKNTGIKYTDFGFEKMGYLGVNVAEDLRITGRLIVGE